MFNNKFANRRFRQRENSFSDSRYSRTISRIKYLFIIFVSLLQPSISLFFSCPSVSISNRVLGQASVTIRSGILPRGENFRIHHDDSSFRFLRFSPPRSRVPYLSTRYRLEGFLLDLSLLFTLHRLALANETIIVEDWQLSSVEKYGSRWRIVTIVRKTNWVETRYGIRKRYLFRILVARIFLAACSLLDRLHRYLTSPPLGQTCVSSHARVFSRWIFSRGVFLLEQQPLL